MRDFLVTPYQRRVENCSGTLQICKENVLKGVIIIVFRYTYPEHDGDVATYTIEDVSIERVFAIPKALQIEYVKYVQI